MVELRHTTGVGGADRPALAEVCAAQWSTTHEAVLADAARHGTDVTMVPFADVTGPLGRRISTFTRLSEWLDEPGVDLSPLGRLDLPPVMATAAPRPRRWAARAEMLAPVLGSPAIVELADDLGCGDRTSWA